jgi:Carboxypeptidase regulatory-like domain
MRIGLLRRVFCLSAIVALLAVLAVSSATAQSGKGAISGTVTESSDAVLQGAQITLQPGDISATSDAAGRFFINGLVPGTYTIYVNYVGFATLSKSINVAFGQPAAFDVKLTVSSAAAHRLPVA